MRMKHLFAAVLILSVHNQGRGQDEEVEAAPPLIEAAEAAELAEGDPDPFGGDAYPVRPLDPERGDRRTMSVLVRSETYELPTLTALALLDGWKVQDGADALRSQIVDLVKTEQASIVDLKAATVEAGSKATIEGIHEFIYPTEYEPPTGLPSPKDLEAEPESAIGKLFQVVNDHFIPTAFETRNTGETLEIEIGVVRAEEDRWDVRLAPERVEFVGMESYGPEGAEVEMPLFNSTRTSSSIRVRDGIWTLTSTITPYEGRARRDEVKRLSFLKVERAR